MAQAAESDKRLAGGQARPMEGLPLGIKDLICTKGIKTTSASICSKNFIFLLISTVTQNLFDAGAVMLGKTNMDEFAMGSSNMTSYFGNCISPGREKDRPEKELVPGGSSGGSAAAVAAKLCLAATASDTGGSIRQTAAYCGLVGIKPPMGFVQGVA